MTDEPHSTPQPSPMPSGMSPRPEETDTQNEEKTHRKQLTIWIISGVVLAIALYFYFLYEEYNPATDDAYVQAHVVNIAAQVGGPVTQIYVNNNAYVKKGQLLALIDPRPYEDTVLQTQSNYRLALQQMGANVAAIDVAQANINKAQANLVNDAKNYERISTLVKTGQASISSGDSALAQYQTSQAALLEAQKQLVQAQQNLGVAGESNADVQKAKADVNTAELNLSYTQIRAPADGFVTNFEVRVGTTVTAQQQLFQLVEDKHWYVYANYKETQLNHIRPGQIATVEVDTYPGKVFHGYVDSLSRGSGAAFSLLPPENATGNWVKVTQRIPVKIMIIDPSPDYPLSVGASSNVRIHTRDYIDKKIIQSFADSEH